MRTGVLLLNVGTPKDQTLAAVREYLRDFLSDPLVIKGPDLFRRILVQGFILPFRAPKSLERYKKIWMAEGSPLAVYSQQLADAVQAELGDNFVVRTGFSYGSYPIADAVKDFRREGCRGVCLVPLFPQKTASTTTGSLLAARGQAVGFDQVYFTREFYNQEWFHRSWAEVINRQAEYRRDEPLVFSYHSLPISALKEERPNYLEQCLSTTEGICSALDLPLDQTRTSFQSRLGVGKWISPFTLDVLKELRSLGHQRVSVACPAFVVDGLESLEEIGIELRDDAIKFGMEVNLIPCLNSSRTWVLGLAQWIKRSLPHENSPAPTASI